jgi:endo-1,4-beta-xylanase
MGVSRILRGPRALGVVSAAGAAAIFLCGCLASVAPSRLKVAAGERGILIGTAVRHRDFVSDSRYRRRLASDFHLLTPEYVMKMGPLQPEEGEWRFRDADQLVRFAKRNGLKVRGHALVWHRSLPEWLEEEPASPRVMRERMVRHVEEVVSRYAKRAPETLIAWDVVNEPVANDATPRSTPFSDADTGPYGYVAEALRAARRANSEATLFINEYGVLDENPKSDELYRLASYLRETGAPLDAVGFQAHLKLDKPPRIESVRRNMRRFAELGLEIQITEMDVAIPKPASEVTDRDLAAQGRLYREVFEACLRETRCTAFTVWGMSDGHTTIPGPWTRGYSSPLLFDRELEPKPAHGALLEALSSEAAKD